MTDKLKNLLIKIKALAERGDGGEKKNAKDLLESLLKKHDIKIEELEIEDWQAHEFKCQIDYRWLFIQVASTVLGEKFDVFVSRREESFVFLSCTNIHAIEISAKFAFYLKAYKKELKEFEKKFNSAFIQANRLFPSSDDSNDDSDIELTKEQIEVLKMAFGMNKYVFNKQLT